MKIEHNIPIPDDPRGKLCKYPWKEMKVGDSIVIPASSISVAAMAQKRIPGIKFTRRRINKKEFRVWRVK